MRERSGMNLLSSLPALCLDKVTEMLLVPGLLRRQCDIVRDCIVLAATDKETRKLMSVPMATTLNPANSLEILEASLLPALASQLRAACRANHLSVCGNKTTLRTRLQVSLQDPRFEVCGMGRHFCELRRLEYVDFSNIDASNLVEELGVGHDLLDRPYTFRDFVRAILAPYDGNSERLFAARDRLKAEREARTHCLIDALRARGCLLRGDSEVSFAYINGTQSRRTLQATVDCAEGMQFFYRETDYKKILMSARYFDRDEREQGHDSNSSTSSSSHQEDEERRRRRSKTEAIRRWLALNARPDMSHIRLMPRSLRPRKYR